MDPSVTVIRGYEPKSLESDLNCGPANQKAVVFRQLTIGRLVWLMVRKGMLGMVKKHACYHSF